MNIFYYPTNSNNHYFINVINAIENNNCYVKNKNYSEVKVIIKSIFSKKKNKPSIIHLNHIEENAALHGLKAIIKSKIILMWLRIYKLLGGKIVWTLHNTKSHIKDAKDQTKFIKKLLKMTSLVIIHTKDSYEILKKYNYDINNVLYVPIGNYCEAVDQYLQKKNKNDKLKLFYFGPIAHYKGIERLVEVFKDDYIRENANLVICGKPNNEQIKENLIKNGKENLSIQMNFSFLSDKELVENFMNADIGIFPFNKESMQNSSSDIMAFTCATPVITSLFGYIKDIKDKPFVISYDYNTEEEHFNNLKESIIKCINMHKENSNIFIGLGEEARKFAITELDWHYIGKKIVDSYKRILDR